MSLLRPSSGENKTSNFKRSKSLRASVKFMSKIRTHPYMSTRTESNHNKILSNPSKDDENIYNLSRLKLSSDFGVNGSDELENSSKLSKNLQAKISSKSILSEIKETKDRPNKDEITISNQGLKSYENLAFSDNSFDSTTDSFFYGNELNYLEKQCDYEVCQKPSQEMCNSNNQSDRGVTVIMKNESNCKIHEWCTRVKMPSAKYFFQNTKKHKNNVLVSDGQEENKFVNLQVPLNQPLVRMPKETKLKSNNKIVSKSSLRFYE